NDIENIKFYLIYNNFNKSYRNINSTNKKKDKIIERQLLSKNKIINNIFLPIYPFNSNTLNIKKHNISLENEIII
ncbi:hypothetical protein DJ52_05260, partial [Brachyspira murdochii]